MPDDEVSLPESLPERIWHIYRAPLLLGSASFLLIIFSIVILVKSIQTTTPITFSEESATSSGKASTVSSAESSNEAIMVDVEGAVVSPGIYRLPRGARVEEALAAAGGLNSEADVGRIAQTINRAAIISDGAKIFIPKTGESPDNTVRREPQSVEGVTLISVNLASQAELETLTGVGPVTAQKIIAGRPYQNLTELVTKKAMSQSLFSKLQNSLSL